MTGRLCAGIRDIHTLEMVRSMEVRAFIVAMKSRNGDGAKGGREVDA